MKVRSHGFLTLALLCAATVFAQQPSISAEPQTESLKVSAKLIVVPTVVRDKHGVLLPSLKKEDFTLKVDGKPQSIRYFDRDSDLPLTVGLLIDTSMSQREVLDDERTASVAFLDNMLAADRDKAFVIQFASEVNLLQDVTTSRSKLQQALKQIDADKPSFSHGHGHGGGTAFYDAVFLSADEVITKQPGRHALILLTDGDDNNSLKTLPKAIEAAQRADTVLYAIYYHSDHDSGGYGGGHNGGGGGFPGGGGRGGGSGFPGGGGGSGGGRPGGGGNGGGGHSYDRVDGKKVLEQMCSETGGRVFEVSKKETVEKIYAEIGEELRSQYRLGFTPAADATTSGYHQIDLALAGEFAKSKNKIQARDGYYQ